MVSINTVDKYTEAYKSYKKSLLETNRLKYLLQRSEYDIEKEDLKKLAMIITKHELEQVRRRVESRNIPDLPWNVKEVA